MKAPVVIVPWNPEWSREFEQERVRLESVSGDRASMIRPFADVKAEYIPHAGIDQRFQRFAYYGSLRQWRR